MTTRAKADSSRRPVRDKRLLGEWRSDKRRTVAEWRFRKSFSAERRKRFFNIFGKLHLRFTPSRMLSKLNGHVDSTRYRVLASDADSVAVQIEDQRMAGRWTTIEHIHFEGSDRYWISLGGNREWFKRVKITKPRRFSR